MSHPGTSTSSKIYRPEMSATWWLKSRSYFLFMMRELSSVFIALFVLVYLYEFLQLSRGPEAYGNLREWLSRPGAVAFYGVAFLFAVYHTVTWFQALTRIQVVRLGAWTMPGWMILAGALGAWIVISAAVAAYFLGA